MLWKAVPLKKLERVLPPNHPTEEARMVESVGAPRRLPEYL
jgi:hypothetical protein